MFCSSGAPKRNAYEFGEYLRAEEVELEEEGNAASFLGVQLH